MVSSRKWASLCTTVPAACLDIDDMVTVVMLLGRAATIDEVMEAVIAVHAARR